MSVGDVALWDFLDEVGIATVSQMSRHLGRSESTLRRRLPKHRRLRICGSRSVGNGSHQQAWWLTKYGAIAGVGHRDLTGMGTPALASIPHALALTEVYIILSAEYGSKRLVHERDIVNIDLHGNTKVAAAYAGSRGKVLIRQPQFVFPLTSLEGTGILPIAGIHIPDLLVLEGTSSAGGGRYSMNEIEITAKAPHRVKRLLAAASSPYLAPHISSITFWVCTEKVERLIRRCAKSAGVDVEIRWFAHPVPDLLWRA